MAVRLLGPVEVCIDDRPIELGSRKRRAVFVVPVMIALALLLWHRRHSIEPVRPTRGLMDAPAG